MIRLIDVSCAQGAIDWPRVRASGLVDECWIKATQGAHAIDPCFAANREGAERAGYRPGIYHFACPTLGVDPESDARSEAEHYVRTVESVTTLDTGTCLDIEHESLTGRPFVAWVAAWLARVRELLSVRAVIYTGGPFWTTSVHGQACPISGHPLWLAAYVTDPSRYVPREWSSWTLWQRSGNVAANGAPGLRVPGISTVVDDDVYLGTLAEYRALVRALHDVRVETPLDARTNAPATPIGSELRPKDCEEIP